jgi:ribonuclease P protein component
MYLSTAASTGPVRFGFIVPKSVGIAVERNLVRRRMKAISREYLDGLAGGTEVVFRALPGAAQSGWDNLRSEIASLMDAASKDRRVPRP